MTSALLNFAKSIYGANQNVYKMCLENIKMPIKTPIFCVCNWPWWLSFELTHNILQCFKACLNYFEKSYHEKFYHISSFVRKISISL